jgi:hypothetical protein
VVPEDCHAIGTPVTAASATVLTEQATLDCGPGGVIGRTFRIEGLDHTGTDVVARIGGTTRILDSDHPTLTVPAPDLGPGALAYLPLGVEHILLGPDHLLFVLGLVLLAGTRRRLLIGTITAFTVGHSITLALAALGYVSFPIRAVEAIIALSVLLLAVEALRERASAAGERPWVFAIVCGLLHGLGFAGALSEVGLPAGEVTLALALFNVGVELGQLAFVAALLALRALASHLVLPPKWGEVRVAAVYGMGSVAAFWVLDRAVPIVWG